MWLWQKADEGQEWEESSEGRIEAKSSEAKNRREAKGEELGAEETSRAKN
jgi:hypothetical protein